MEVLVMVTCEVMRGELPSLNADEVAESPEDEVP